MLNIIFYLYLLSLATAAFFGYSRYKYLDQGIKIIINLIAITLLSETLTFFVPLIHKGKEVIYHFYSIVEITAVTLFFLRTIDFKRRKSTDIFVIAIWAAVGIGNMMFQTVTTINTNMLIIESVSIIAMSLFALYSIFIDDKLISIKSNAYFWIWVCFLLLWSTTFFFWAFFEELIKKKHKYRDVMLAMQGMINIIVYLGIGLSAHLKQQKTTE